MTEILLIRHGETAWNREEVFRGRMDIELSETGIAQAEALAAYLADVQIDVVYSSPLSRAVRTAQAVADSHGLPVKQTPALIDFDFGVWHGLPIEQVRKEFPVVFQKWSTEPQMVKITDGEMLGDVRRRAMKLLDDVIASGVERAALVAHRVVNKVLICAMLGLDDSHFWNIRCDTCGITTFSYRDGRYILAGHNDTSFLRKLGKSDLADF